MRGEHTVYDMPSQATVSPTDPSPRAPTIREAAQAAFDCDLPGLSRLRYARTTVRFSVRGGQDAVTLLLDRDPPALAGDSAPAEVTIELEPELVDPFLVGRLSLHRALLSGGARASGPVSRYLEIDPMLRRRLAHANYAGNGRFDPASHVLQPQLEGASYGELPAELLAIEVRDLHKRFGAQRVLQGISLGIPEGVISVLLGPSGTGKSVLLKNIMGLMAHDGGDVVIRGRPMSRMTRSELLALRREVGLMFQDGALFSTMNLYDNVAFPLRQHTEMSEAAIRDVVMDHLVAVGLQDAVERYPSELSGGMRKRAGLARAFALDPGIVLCDEPDSGLDPVRTALLAELLREQHARNGGTVLVITHNILLARQIGDHVSVIWKGKIVESGMAEVVFNSDSPFVQQFLAGGSTGPLGME
jgi:phospholipid/cholesterol/gamma-HCH transport system ATP-binding protein